MSHDHDGQRCAAHHWLASDAPIEQVPVASLQRGDSPRLTGDSKLHAAWLRVAADTPPIIVHRPTMGVIDGARGVAAARRRHQDTIAVRFFDGTAEEAFVLGVVANITTHGLPLSPKDRKAAAARILGMYPAWSDRAIASTAGLSHPTVGAIRRRCSTGNTFQLNSRVGKDGKARPLTTNDGREAAAELIRADQSTPVREVARQAGVSVGTVHDVRSRLSQGIEPTVPTTRATGFNVHLARGEAALIRLWNDPAVRSPEKGKAMLELLAHSLRTADEAQAVCRNAPEYCRDTVAEFAAAVGDVWTRLARELRSRAHAG